MDMKYQIHGNVPTNRYLDIRQPPNLCRRECLDTWVSGKLYSNKMHLKWLSFSSISVFLQYIPIAMHTESNPLVGRTCSPVSKMAGRNFAVCQVFAE